MIGFYKSTLAAWLGGNCRFEPSCSRYAQNAFERLGFLQASWLTIKRLLKCHPLGSHGYDPVPEPSAQRICLSPHLQSEEKL